MTADQKMTFQAGDDRRARGDAEVEGFRTLSHALSPSLERDGWLQRIEGADGLGCWDHPRRNTRLIHSIAREGDGEVWAHLSVSRRDRTLPTWEQVRDVKQLLYPDLVGLIVLAPVVEHYSFAEVHHVWVCLSRRPTPAFGGADGSI